MAEGIECGLLCDFNWDMKEINKLNCRKFPIRTIGTEEDRYFIDPFAVFHIQQFQPDIIWTNDPCKVGAYRSVFNGKIIAYNHWIDTPNYQKMPWNKTYYLRQLEGFVKADYMLFNSKAGVDMWLDQDLGTMPWKAKTGFVNPPLRTEVLSKYCDIAYKSPTPTLLFNHRLSSATQYKENIDNFIVVVEYIRAYLPYSKFNILVSNPSGKHHSILEWPNVINIYDRNYENYIRRAAAAWCQVTMFDYAGQWSMALAEALTLGMTCVVPSHHGYSEMIDGYRLGSIPYNTGGRLETADAVLKRLKGFASTSGGQINHYLRKFGKHGIVHKQLMPIIKELTS